TLNVRQLPTKLVTLGYLAAKLGACATTTRYWPVPMTALVGKTKSIPPLKVQLDRLTFVAARFSSSTYSSRESSEEGWYMISLMTTSWPRTEITESTTKAQNVIHAECFIELTKWLHGDMDNANYSLVMGRGRRRFHAAAGGDSRYSRHERNQD